jgi:outer membrane protein OmpA-like peptidoglycan-associated protein
MKKLSLIIIFVSSIILVRAQNATSENATEEKKERKGAHYLSVGLGLGPSGFNYDLRRLESIEGSRSLRLGGNALIGYSYFFHKNWGIGTGLGVAHFRTIGKYKGGFSDDEFLSLGHQVDDDMTPGQPKDYELRVRLANWEERQTATYLEIPLLLQFQHKFGMKQKFGLYFNIGAKFQIPLGAKYEVLDGDYDGDPRLNVSGFYGAPANMDLGSPSNPDIISYHGFGSIHNPNEQLDWNDKMKTKFSIAGTAEFGFLFAVARRVDLSLGAFIDYGFMNVKKGDSKALIEAPEASYLGGDPDYVGKDIIYNGMMNSDRIEKAKLFSYGGKIGVRIKLGKIEATPYEKQQEEEQLRREEDSLMRAQQMDYNDAMLKAIKDLQKGMNEILTWKDMVDERLSKPVEVEVKDELPYGMTQAEYDTLMGHTYFTLNSSTLRSSQYPLIDYKISLMRKYPHLRIQVTGNTCDLGSAVLNGNLGLFRAKAVRDYMISKGIPESRIVITTQSFNNPLLPNTSEENRSLNRRCDYEILPQR